MKTLLLSLMLFCPLADTTIVNGYHVWSYIVPLAFTLPTPCPPGLCAAGIAAGELPHDYIQTEWTLDEAGHWMDVPDPAEGEMLLFTVEPNDTPNTSCSPGACSDVWWNVTTDLAAPCVCPNGGC